MINFNLKVPKCVILISWMLMIFFIMKSLQVGYFRDEIETLHFLQLGEIRAIMFLLPHAPSMLANCYRLRGIRQQRATACAANASNCLPHAQHTLAKHRIFEDLILYAQCTLANCYRMSSIRQQIATVCKAYASNLLPHSPSTLAICYRMRSIPLQKTDFYTILLPHAPCALAICYRMRSVCQ